MASQLPPDWLIQVWEQEGYPDPSTFSAGRYRETMKRILKVMYEYGLEAGWTYATQAVPWNRLERWQNDLEGFFNHLKNRFPNEAAKWEERWGDPIEQAQKPSEELMDAFRRHMQNDEVRAMYEAVWQYMKDNPDASDRDIIEWIILNQPRIVDIWQRTGMGEFLKAVREYFTTQEALEGRHNTFIDLIRDEANRTFFEDVFADMLSGDMDEVWDRVKDDPRIADNFDSVDDLLETLQWYFVQEGATETLHKIFKNLVESDEDAKRAFEDLWRTWDSITVPIDPWLATAYPQLVPFLESRDDLKALLDWYFGEGGPEGEEQPEPNTELWNWLKQGLGPDLFHTLTDWWWSGERIPSETWRALQRALRILYKRNDMGAESYSDWADLLEGAFWRDVSLGYFPEYELPEYKPPEEEETERPNLDWLASNAGQEAMDALSRYWMYGEYIPRPLWNMLQNLYERNRFDQPNFDSWLAMFGGMFWDVVKEKWENQIPLPETPEAWKEYLGEIVQEPLTTYETWESLFEKLPEEVPGRYTTWWEVFRPAMIGPPTEYETWEDLLAKLPVGSGPVDWTPPQPRGRVGGIARPPQRPRYPIPTPRGGFNQHKPWIL